MQCRQLIVSNSCGRRWSDCHVFDTAKYVQTTTKLKNHPFNNSDDPIRFTRFSKLVIRYTHRRIGRCRSDDVFLVN